MNSMAHAPLHGTTVVDLTRLLPGPMCTQYLVDLGATVIKVEHPVGGDYARRPLDAAPDEEPEQSAFFRAVNRGKHSVTLDLTRDVERERLIDLVRDADVVLESFRPGVVAKLGIDYATLAAIKPALVYVSITGYGQFGPLSDLAGHDLNYLAYAGLLDLLRDDTGKPVLPRFQIADVMGGSLHAVIAVLTGIVERQRTGQGRFYGVSMTECCKPLNIGPLTMSRSGPSLLDGSFACYQIYQTSDRRHLTVGAGEPKFWARLCAALQRPDLQPFQFDEGRQAWLKSELAGIFGAHPLDHWCNLLVKADCCFAPVLGVAEAMANGKAEAELAEIASSDVTFELPIQISGYTPDSTASSPALGEHNHRYFGEPDEARAREETGVGPAETGETT